MTTILVACVGKKLPERALACDLYQSPWFLKARRYAELVGDRWFILSAKYGLIHPVQFIEPYNLTLNEMRRDERVTWATGVWLHLLKLTKRGERIVMLAGARYRDPLKQYLETEGRVVKVPMIGLGIGQQLRWLDEQIKVIQNGGAN